MCSQTLHVEVPQPRVWKKCEIAGFWNSCVGPKWRSNKGEWAWLRNSDIGFRVNRVRNSEVQLYIINYYRGVCYKYSLCEFSHSIYWEYSEVPVPAWQSSECQTWVWFTSWGCSVQGCQTRTLTGGGLELPGGVFLEERRRGSRQELLHRSTQSCKNDSVAEKSGRICNPFTPKSDQF